MDVVKKRGGTRLGAGRPLDGIERRVTISVSLDPSQITEVEEYRLAHGLASRSEALRRMAFPARVVR